MAPRTTEDCLQNSSRPLGNFAPSMWGDLFLSLPIHNQVDDDKKIQRLKEEVKAMLVDTGIDRSKKIDIIYCLHRLGLSYHFENEIYSQLETHFGDNLYQEDGKEYDLYTISTQFLTFRQHGFKMSCDVFNKFKDPSGEFMDTLATDIRGMLSLYEASHLRVRGEDVLEEALAFTTINFRRMEMEGQILSPFLTKQVARALKESFHWGVPRVEARAYISIYQEDHESQNESILELAKLDFNVQQQMHQQELRLVLKWWKDSEFREKLPYVRDRAVEAYFYGITTFPEPRYSLARISLAKCTLFLTAVNDTYDAFGTFEELQLFTDAVSRWDINTIDQLPDNMKFLYTKLMVLYNELHQSASRDAQSYGVPDSIERMKEVCTSYYESAKWLNEGYIPKLDDEYSKVANVSIIITILVTLSCFAMNDIAPKESFEWLRGEPKLLELTNAIARLQNDLAGREYEQKRKHSVSAVECYMKQYGVPFDEAIGELRKRIADGLKDFNEEYLKPAPLHLRKWLINLIRFTSTAYRGVDGFTQPHIIKDVISSVLVDPVPL